MESVTLILARELRGKDITVNAVAPGPTATALFLSGKDEAAVEALSQMVPLERLSQPDDIAETASFLAGPARWNNGQVIFVNGGLASVTLLSSPTLPADLSRKRKAVSGGRRNSWFWWVRE